MEWVYCDTTIWLERDSDIIIHIHIWLSQLLLNVNNVFKDNTADFYKFADKN